MKMANKIGALNVIIIGENEIKGGFLTVKNLETGKQEERTEEELING
jgi:anticodon binding domain